MRLDKKRQSVTELLQKSAPGNRLLPLTTNQRRSWEHLKQNPESTFFTISFQIRFEGRLDPLLLERSLVKLITEQEALRVKIVETEQGPLQFLTPVADFKLQSVDLSGLSDAERKQSVTRITHDNFARPFDFDSEPAFAAKLLLCGPEDSTLLFRSFQTFCDGIALFFVIKEVLQNYRLLGQSETVVTRSTVPSYLDQVDRMLDYGSSPNAATDLAYWKKELKDVPVRIHFPPRAVANQNASPAGPTEAFKIGGETYKKIQAFCRAQGVTPYVFFLTALNLTVYRRTHQPDFVVRTLMNNRTEYGEESWGMVGDFVNPVALRTSIRPEMTISEYLHLVRDKVMQAHTHSRAPYLQVLAEVLEPSQRGQFANVSLVMNNLEVTPVLEFSDHLKGYPSVHMIGPSGKSTSLELQFQFLMFADFFSLQLQYNFTSWAREDVLVLYDAFLNSVEAVTQRPQTQIRVLEGGHA